MDFFFASGDSLVLDSEAKNTPEKIKAGDIIAYLDWADAPLVSVHRVMLRFTGKDGGARFLTKGDGNLWFDPPVSAGQVLGKVVEIRRPGLEPLGIDLGPGRGAGLLIAGYSYFAVLAVRACESAAGLLQRAVCLGAAAAAGSGRCFPLFRHLLPALLRTGLWADLNRHESFYAVFSWLPGKLAKAARAAGGRQAFPMAAAEQPAETFLSGNIRERLVLSGRVTIGGDVTILPGASLVLQPGASVNFAAGKSSNSRALRTAGRDVLNFENGKLCKLLVYGEFVCAGSAEAPVRLGGSGDKWDALIFLGRSTGRLDNVLFSGAANPLRVMDFARVRLTSVGAGQVKEFCVLSGCASVELRQTRLDGVAAPAAAHDLARLTARDCSFVNSGAAVRVSGLARCRLTRCVFSAFSEYALRADEAGAVFAGNCSVSGGELPIFGAGGSSLRLRGTEITKAAGPAVTFQGRSLKVTGCRVHGNFKAVLFSGGRAALKSSVFSRNTVFALDAARGDVSAEDCVFEAGAPGAAGQGGPVISFRGGTLELTRCQLRDNARALLLAGRRARLKACVFSRNSIFTVDAVSGDLTAENCVFDANSGGPVLTFRGRRLEISAAEARDNAGGLLIFGRQAFITASVFLRNAGAGLELNKGLLQAAGCSFVSNQEGFRAGAGVRARLTRCSFSSSAACAVSAGQPGARVELAETEIDGCRRGVHAAGSRVLLEGAVIRGCLERGLFLEAGAALDCRGGEIFGCAAQAVRLETGAWLRMAGTRIAGNGDGISAEDGTVRLDDVRFADNAGTSISLNGGAHKVENCSLQRGGVGVGVYKNGRCDARDVTVSGTKGAALEVSAALARVSNIRIRACAAGVKAESGARLEAVGLSIDGVRAHGLLARGGSFIQADGVEILNCGGSAVLASNLCGLRLKSLKAEKCAVGLTLEQGGSARLEAARLTDIAGCCVSCSGGTLDAAAVTLLRANTGFSITEGGAAGIRNSEVADMAGSCVSCSAGKVNAWDVKLLRGKAGFSLHSGAAAGITRAEISLMAAGLEATGGSAARLKNSVLQNCGRGAWLQDGSSAEVLGGRFESSADAGIYADGGACSARGTAFSKNNIGVFADRGAEVRLRNARFSGNRTGLKADNGARVNLAASTISGCEWDGVWCGGNAALVLANNTFASNRHGIKEDGPCAVSAADNKFRENSAADHLAWPRQPRVLV
ncbi:MAG: hypothetical protein A2X35_10615 [Elusimicrobia bacterium GWA2_61_42]|nr:MAG: hypothetical protein A2X35_10615 [Elusimicrobia bacterium GWA2_61_42]OGR74713.1 MAG: hypothetical protein A2X38_02580 [Elusimicrobia bacterium GWC2_61_25]